MRLWSWARGVIADTGEPEPIPIHLERTDEDGYAFRLGLRAGFGGHETARVPVERRVNLAPHPILKEIHHCEVAGQVLEAANLYSLRAKVGRALETLAPARTLPICEFRVPAMDYALPVYEHGGMLTSPVLGGPKLKAPDLAGIRLTVCRYLESAGYVNDADDVAVGVIRPSDLRRVAPAAVFRSSSDAELWLPAVEGYSDEGPVVGILGHVPQLGRPETRPAASDVINLLRYMRSELGRSGSIASWGLYASEVRTEIWAAAAARAEDAGSRLVAHLSDDEGTRLELQVRRTGAGDVAVALEDRGVNVFLAPDEEALAIQVGHHLAGAEFLPSAEDVEVHPTELVLEESR
jgi:hypothetical protein